MPGAKKDSLELCPDGTVKAWVKARPVEGKANHALLCLISQYFNLPRSSIEIVKGVNSRKKLIKIKGLEGPSKAGPDGQ